MRVEVLQFRSFSFAERAWAEWPTVVRCKNKTSAWKTRSQLPGWVIDTDSLSISLSEAENQQVTKAATAVASGTQVGMREKETFRRALVFFCTSPLLHVSIASRPRKPFVHRMLASTAVRHPFSSRVVTGDDLRKRAATNSRMVALGPEFHDDFDVWHWLVCDELSRWGASGCVGRGHRGLLSAIRHMVAIRLGC